MYNDGVAVNTLKYCYTGKRAEIFKKIQVRERKGGGMKAGEFNSPPILLTVLKLSSEFFLFNTLRRVFTAMSPPSHTELFAMI